MLQAPGKPSKGPKLGRAWLAAILVVTLMAAAGAAAADSQSSAVYGLVTSDTGKPVPGVIVELYKYGSGLVATAAAKDSDGSFRLPLDGGTAVYWLRAWAKDYATAERVWVPGQGGPIAELQLTPLNGSVLGQITAPDGGAVPGAKVNLVQPANGIIATTQADHNGRFRITDVRAAGAGNYAVQVLAPLWQPYQVELPAVTGGGGHTVAAKLAPAAGTVTGTIVSRATGKPLPGARVTLVRLAGGAASVLAVADADAGGQYTFNFAADYRATYAIRAAASGYGAATGPSFSLDASGRRDLSGGESLALSQRYGAISGRVIDSDGDPFLNIEVWLESRGAGIAQTAFTGGDGLFSFDQIPLDPGREYRVRVVPPGRANRAAATGWLSLTPGRTATVSISLTKGTVNDEGDGTIRGIVSMPGGAPVPGATVDLLRAGDIETESTVTDDQGRYRFDEVKSNIYFDSERAPGNGYVVRARKQGYTASAEVIGPAAADTINVGHKVEATADLILYPATGTFSGRVLDDSGKPVPDAIITFTPEGGPLKPVQSRSDAAGRFRVLATASERYRIEAQAPGYLPGMPAAWPAELRAGTDVAIDLVLRRQSAELNGIVTDARGRPVSGAVVAVSDHGPAGAAAGSAFQATTGLMGEYSIAGVPADRPVAVTVRRAGYRDSTLVAGGSGLAAVEMLLPGEKRQLDLLLAPTAGAVAGMVVGEDGAPVGSVRVELMREGLGPVQHTFTNNQGLYEFKEIAVEPGARYLVRAHLPGYRFRLAAAQAPPSLFAVPAGDTVRVHLLLVPAP